MVFAKTVIYGRLEDANALAECYSFQTEAMEENIEEAGYAVCDAEGHESS